MCLLLKKSAGVSRGTQTLSTGTQSTCVLTSKATSIFLLGCTGSGGVGKGGKLCGGHSEKQGQGRAATPHHELR